MSLYETDADSPLYRDELEDALSELDRRIDVRDTRLPFGMLVAHPASVVCVKVRTEDFGDEGCSARVYRDGYGSKSATQIAFLEKTHPVIAARVIAALLDAGRP